MVTEANQRAVSTLNDLTEIVLASEKGFNVSAQNVHNRALKLLFKTYAQQRSQFADALQAEVASLGGHPEVRWKPLAALHRGWINIKAGMTIGSENIERVVLAEALRGESVALRSYERALRDELPAASRQIVERQYEQVQKVRERIWRLTGRQGEREVVRLFDNEADATMAIDALREKGFSRDQVQLTPINEVVTFYEEKHKERTVVESAAAGGAVGGLVGGILGVIAGAGAMALSAMGVDVGIVMGAGVFVLTIFLGIVVGLMFGGFMGALLGIGIAEDDSHQYVASVKQGNILMTVTAARERAEAANQVMLSVNAARQRGPVHAG